MTQTLKLSVPGKPGAKQRPRSSARVVYQDGRPMAVVNVRSDAGTVAQEAEVLRLFRMKYPNHSPWTGPVLLRFTAVFETPESWTKALKEAARSGRVYHSGRPDKDNIEKLIVDALNGWAFVDDGQVQGGGVKRYGSPARIDIELTLLAQPDLPLTPAEKNAERRVEQGKIGTPQRRTKKNPPKTKYPAAVQARIDAALAREGRGP